MMLIYIQKSCIQVHLIKHFNLLRYYSKYVGSIVYSNHVLPEHKRLLTSFSSQQHFEYVSKYYKLMKILEMFYH